MPHVRVRAALADGDGAPHDAESEEYAVPASMGDATGVVPENKAQKLSPRVAGAAVSCHVRGGETARHG
jgi:hypothetical protein